MYDEACKQGKGMAQTHRLITYTLSKQRSLSPSPAFPPAGEVAGVESLRDTSTCHSDGQVHIAEPQVES